MSRFPAPMRKATLELQKDDGRWELPLDLERLPQQKAFLSDWSHRFQGYGGGLGNGKTTAGCVKAWMLSYLFPGNKGWIGRWDGKELRQTTIAELLNLIPEGFIAQKSDQKGYLRFKPQYGGSEIFYGDFKDARSLKSLNLGWFWIDQAEEIDKERWDHAVSRLRLQLPMYDDKGKKICGDGGRPIYAPTYGFATFNPEGSDSFLWRYFHPDSPLKNECICAKTPGQCVQHNYALYMASTFDGLAAGFVSQEYVDGMLAIFPPQARERYLEGSWDIFEGRVFPSFSAEQHVIDPPTIQPHWKIYESIDHGLQNPTAVQWWAVDENNNRILVDEHYEGGLKPVSYHAEIIKAKRRNFKQPIAVTYLDSQCWAMDSSKGDKVYSVYNEYTDAGIYPIPGQKDWGAAFNRITQGLRSEPAHTHPITGVEGAPHIYISAHCTNFIKEALAYRWKKARVGINQANAPETPIDYNDHHMDAWAYFEASRVSGPDAADAVKLTALEIVQRRIASYNPLSDTEHAGSWMSL